MSNHHTAIALANIARDACTDKKSEVYAHLLNTVSACSFELNDLPQDRRASTEALAIREAWAKTKNPGAEEELANQVNNMGVLEAAEGDCDKALELFGRALEIRQHLGDDLIVPIGVTHMTTGRAYFLKGDYVQALEHYHKAEDIFVKQFGRNCHFMAHLNYAYGNLELDRKAPAAAEEFYGRSRSILEADTPLHLLLAATYYKIACLWSTDKSKIEDAEKLLDKGLTIAEFCEGPGDIARILQKKAALLENGTDEEKAQCHIYRLRVGDLLGNLPGVVLSLDDDGNEAEWNTWVCPYWR